jgi:aryl-alcohol dehydrogenase-like predicted oxidoreductase
MSSNIRDSNDTFELFGIPIRPSQIGLGGAPAGGHGWGVRDDSAASNAITCAIENGVTFFDTADVYGLGLAETLLARCLDAVCGSRSSVVIATKAGVAWDDHGCTRRDSTPAYLLKAAEASLQRLRTDCIDLYYLHWSDGSTPLGDSLEALVTLRKQGKIRAIGVSNVNSNDLIQHREIGIAAIQVKGNLLEPHDAIKMAEVARILGAKVICYSGLADGLLSGSMKINQRFSADDHRSKYPLFQPGVFEATLDRVAHVVATARQFNRTAAQLSLRWLLDSGCADAVLCGATKPHHVRENIGAFGWRLRPHEISELSRLVGVANTKAC